MLKKVHLLCCPHLVTATYGQDSPTQGLPKPDLLVSDNNNCSLLVKWFDIYHHKWGTPHFILDVPSCYEPQQKEDYGYILAQYKDLIRLIERLSGQSFDPERVRRAVENTRESLVHWRRFLHTAAHRPSGLTVFDSFVQMAPFLTSRGTKVLAEHYRLLADETEERMARGLFPVPNEKYRLLWDNIAPWHQLNRMPSRLTALEANIIAAPYTFCLGSLEGKFEFYTYDGGDPLHYLAWTQNFSVCPSGMELRFRAMEKAITVVGLFSVRILIIMNTPLPPLFH